MRSSPGLFERRPLLLSVPAVVGLVAVALVLSYGVLAAAGLVMVRRAELRAPAELRVG